MRSGLGAKQIKLDEGLHSEGLTKLGNYATHY